MGRYALTHRNQTSTPEPLKHLIVKVIIFVVSIQIILIIFFAENYKLRLHIFIIINYIHSIFYSCFLIAYSNLIRDNYCIKN